MMYTFFQVVDHKLFSFFLFYFTQICPLGDNFRSCVQSIAAVVKIGNFFTMTGEFKPSVLRKLRHSYKHSFLSWLHMWTKGKEWKEMMHNRISDLTYKHTHKKSYPNSSLPRRRCFFVFHGTTFKHNERRLKVSFCDACSL